MEFKNKWVCYLLKSTNENYKNHTYNGKTNDIQRRLRQHNGELVGGAIKTSKMRPNEIYCVIEGFISNIEVQQAEWRIKHPTKKKKRPYKYQGPMGRLSSLNEILNDTQFTSNSYRLIKDMNLKIWCLKEFKDCLLNIPTYVKIDYVDKFF
jgi:predicted GIY-YIG superfamily endonuclease